MNTQNIKFKSDELGNVDATMSVLDRTEIATLVKIEGTFEERGAFDSGFGVRTRPFEGTFHIREGRDDMDCTPSKLMKEEFFTEGEFADEWDDENLGELMNQIAVETCVAMDDMKDSLLAKEMERICD